MRSVKSRNYFDQMKGRGVRILSEAEMEQVNPGITRKTHFVIVDAAGVCERVKTETHPLESKPGVAFDKLLDAIGLGNREAEALESLANRLIRLEKRLDTEVMGEIVQVAGGQTLSVIAGTLLDSVDPDKIDALARTKIEIWNQPSSNSLQSLRILSNSLNDERSISSGICFWYHTNAVAESIPVWSICF